jgi:DNA end-binding protein Ku
MWRGAISFGLVAIPIRLYLATESKGISFRLLCPTCHEPVKNKRWCSTENREIGWNETIKGFEVSKDDFVEIDDADLEKIPLKTTHTIDIVEFCQDADIDAGVYIKSAYYLEPEKVGVKPYSLLRQALETTGKVAIGKVAFRDREHLCRIALHENGLLLNTLHWPDEIRDAGELGLPTAEQAAEIDQKEVDMAIMLIDNLTATFDPQRYRDGYRDAVLEMVDAKLNDRPLAPVVEPEHAGSVTDLMAVLKASVEAASAAKSENAEPAAKSRKAS